MYFVCKLYIFLSTEHIPLEMFNQSTMIKAPQGKVIVCVVMLLN